MRRIELADIPVVRLRDGLPASLLAGDISFSEAVMQAQRCLRPPELQFDLEASRVWCGGAEVRLQPLLFVWYAWFAAIRVLDLGSSGSVRSTDRLCASFTSFYRTLSADSPAHTSRTERALSAGEITADVLREKVSKIRRALRASLGTAATPYEIHGFGRYPLTHYGLAVPPARIKLTLTDALRRTWENHARA